MYNGPSTLGSPPLQKYSWQNNNNCQRMRKITQYRYYGEGGFFFLNIFVLNKDRVCGNLRIKLGDVGRGHHKKDSFYSTFLTLFCFLNFSKEFNRRHLY